MKKPLLCELFSELLCPRPHPRLVLRGPPPEQSPLVVGLELGVATLLALLRCKRVAAPELGPDQALVL